MNDKEQHLEHLRHELSLLDQKRSALAAQIQKLQTERNNDAISEGENTVDLHSSETAKIGLFRKLFSGREDVFPLRFESRKNGRSGYQPACANEWRPGICHKPKIKCAKCESREFIPISDAIVRQHLSGVDQQGKPFVMGIYPLRMDETCSFLAVDFDKAEWQRDALAFLGSCDAQCIPAYLERSRSGNGGHIWIFFDKPILARLLMCAIRSFFSSASKRDVPRQLVYCRPLSVSISLGTPYSATARRRVSSTYSAVCDR